MGCLFIVDAMLGKTARKLRLAGFDAAYEPDADDDALLETAAAQNRVIITKDAGLCAKAGRAGVPALMPLGNDALRHVLEIAETLNLGAVSIDAARSRCTACNGALRVWSAAPDESPPPDVPPDTILHRCTLCGHIYWHGSHIDNLQRTLSGMAQSQY